MKNYRAVTLIEMVIVIAIIGIVTGITVISLQSGRSTSRLQAAQREVTATIKLAQSYALQGKTQSGTMPCGYGFRFPAADTYEIFYNPLQSGSYTSCTEQNNYSADLQYTGTSQPAESYTLSNGVTLSSPAAGDPSDTEIYFTVPHSNAFDKSGSSYGPQDFEFSFSGNTKRITINPGGYVSEQ